ncbi:MAG: arylsulfatase, partial [Lentisphaerae bacterium]
GDVGCYNPESRIPTPNLDRLSSEGLTFLDAHAPATVCTPSRYSLLTGRMAFRTGMRGVFTGAGGPCLIEGWRLTLPELLRRHGYTTACVGKWHIGLTFLDECGVPICENGLEPVKRIDFSRPIPDAPIHRGFDSFFGTACCGGTDHLYAFIEGDRIPVPPSTELERSALPKHAFAQDNRPGLIAPNYDIQELDQVFLHKSIEFLEEHVRKQPDKPFFLYHATNAVHLPSFASRKFQGKTDAGPHGDFIFEFDAVVGELLAAVERLGIAEHTIFIVTSDNGPEVTTVVNMRREFGHDGARPWRGMKRDNWEGGHRIPFILRWPERVEGGRKTGQTVCLCDIMATCAAIVGADLPETAAEDSCNMLPVILGEQPEEKPVREFCLHQTNRLALGIRRGKWKYLDHKGSGGNDYTHREALKPYALADSAPDAPGQLYDLAEDPGETINCAGEYPDIAAELRSILDWCRHHARSVTNNP